jgi:two-component system, OmpR family, phosphate regulon sensor histidine kinase PhoR
MNPTARWLLAALYFASPALVAFILLVGFQALAPGDAAVAAAAVVLALILMSRPLYAGMARLRRAIEEMAEDETARPEVESSSPDIRELWLAIARWVRSSRQKTREREAEIDTAQLVLRHLPDPILVLDGARRIVRTNEAANELLGPRLVDRDLAGALRQPALLAAADAVLRGEGDRVVDIDLNAPGERHFSARIVPLVPPLADGNAVVILHDLTVLKRSERLRADFAANASHELRTPLASLIGFIETLRGPARDDAEAHERFLAIMAGQSARMARLVEDLLSLSKIEMNEHQTPTERIEIAKVLDMVASGLEPRAASRNMRIALACPAETPTVLGDFDELAQVFQNLIDNAIKYATPGTVIEVAVGPSAKTLAGGRAGERLPAVSVVVRDQSEGIPREHLLRLTERFYRVDAARSRELGGTGLGLAIVKHIVNHHRGQLDIESELGKGSLFTVHLPIAAP